MDQFQDSGGPAAAQGHLVSKETAAQLYQTPQLPLSSSIDAFQFDPDYCYDGISSSDYMLSASHFDWSDLQTSSTQQIQHHGVYDFNLANCYAVRGKNPVAAGISHAESSLMDTGANYASAVHEFTSTVPTGSSRQQSSWQPQGKKCTILSCEFHYTSLWEYENHMRAMHQDVFTCEECMYVGKSHYQLGLHASDTGHASFICKHDDCEKRFSRLDTYQRHQRTHRDDAKRFPCKYCKKYRGKNGFKRKDHLNQHVRNYHHIGEGEQVGHLYDRKWCPKEACSESKPATVSLWDLGVFTSSKEWVNHMRTVHDESEYSCPQPGCHRINGKGYFRPADLRTHLRKVHGTDGSFDQSIWHNLWQ